MAEISVVYIGDKDKKRDTVTGSRLIFPRLKPVSVESGVAHQLLEFPTVWVREDLVKSVLAQSEEDEALKVQLAAEALARQQAEAAANSWVVKIGNDDVDLAKLTSVQLATLVEAEDLADLKQGAQEKVDDFRARVREAIKVKGAE
ncbi:hypothetical protein [Pectobacterium parmentieri]|uniref:Uncharacterized protein n=1 Tax=Pectobacterium parmentieri TaxID=1905730 RepID=A0A8B3FB97_PECPM|nr:hypothetical protein [Pectobacterium parmentieri]AOR58825.1 hypothetical protein A8F97_07880 [Pectobacterium parmentieri]AYH10139.1 hypothetical protein C5E24_10830 [Pectobacterium parmentieri]AYH19150.1 hypothetical protein C5E22_11960 [Pectobacterium parmentieri]AYH36458.1 hypothetical protein C5E17_10775 [Pectobacterium parmentieri]AZS56564.1 hypothetical protein C5E18_10775 [Pectobacterium parmentieri]